MMKMTNITVYSTGFATATTYIFRTNNRRIKNTLLNIFGNSFRFVAKYVTVIGW